MTEQKITIKKADNGFILSWMEEFEDEFFPHSIVVELDDDCNHETLADLKAIREVFWQLQEFFGIWGSKHNYKLYIEIRDSEDRTIDDENRIIEKVEE